MTHPYAGTAHQLLGTHFAEIEYVESTGSTNADAAAWLGDTRYAGRTLVAEFQSSGAGRKGRSWIAQPSTALLFTTVLPRPVATKDLWIVPFWTALAVSKALAKHDIRATLHWPNDLLLDGRKVSGILCQSRVTGETAWVLCGVGINVRRPANAETLIDPPPAFCDDVTPVDRAALLHAVLVSYEASLDTLAEPTRVAAAWEAAAGLPGARYRILKDGEPTPFEAMALRLASGGGLVVQHDDGETETIALADARALR